MTDPKALEIAAQCWCDPRVSDRVMDPELATVFAEKLEAVEAKLKVAVEALWAIAEYPAEGGDFRFRRRAENALATIRGEK